VELYLHSAAFNQARLRGPTDVGMVIVGGEILPLLCIERQVVRLKTCHFGRRVTLAIVGK